MTKSFYFGVIDCVRNLAPLMGARFRSYSQKEWLLLKSSTEARAMKRYLVLIILFAGDSAYPQDGGALGFDNDVPFPGATKFEELAQRQDGVPADIAKVREEQMLRSRNEDVEINIRDEGLTSLSLLAAVPREFRDVEISNESDLVDILDRLYPYYGFTGTESLEVRNKRQDDETTYYMLNENINGIPTSYSLNVLVNNSNNRIGAFLGTLRIDRGFQPGHMFTEHEALEKVREYIARSGKVFDVQEDPSSSLYYDAWGGEGGIAPWWRIRVHGISYYVSPSGEVDQSSGASEVR
jgi:hypothetical protein